jgi:hypothetical protein
MRFFLLIVALAMFAACGIPDDKKLGELTDDEIKELCEEVEDETKDCGEGVEVTRSSEQCAENKFKEDCAGTVANWRACNEADACDLSNSDCGKAASCLED